MKRLYIILIYFIISIQSVYSQIPEKLIMGDVEITNIEYPKPFLGKNAVSISVTNKSDSLRNIWFSNRVESATWNWQSAQYYPIKSKETLVIKEYIQIGDETSNIIKVVLAVPNKVQKRPEDTVIIRTAITKDVKFPYVERFQIKLDFVFEKSHFWNHTQSLKIKNIIPQMRDSVILKDKIFRDSLKRMLGWDRVGSNDFRSEKLKTKRNKIEYLDKSIIVETWNLYGEPENPVGFLLMQQKQLQKPFKTVLYMSGNPTGIKEDQVMRLLKIAESGYRVVIIGRRESARNTEMGEFWDNLADPVFDAKHLIDYLMKLDETDKNNGIGLIGFSKGAAEGQFLAALHDDISCVILLNRMIDNDFLFKSEAWWPTLYNPDILVEMGADSILTKSWEEQFAFMRKPTIATKAKKIYDTQWSFYDSKVILKLVTPKPLLIVAGALDEQFPLEGVLSLDKEIRQAYESYGLLPAYNIFIDPRSGHRLSVTSMQLIIEYLSIWL